MTGTVKKPFRRKGRRDKSGIILIIVLWVLMILSLVVVGLGRRAHIDLALTKYSVGKVRSRYRAMSGFLSALEQVRKDNEDPETKDFDTKALCGFRKDEGKTAQDIFSSRDDDGGFEVGFIVPGSPLGEEFRYGLRDEESRINLNTMTSHHAKALANLLVLAGEDESLAETVAAGVMDWKDADQSVFSSGHGKDEDYPTYACKNKPLDSAGEMLLVQGMTPDIFRKIQDHVTVFPKQGRFQVNFDTAPKIVLQSLARAYAGTASNTQEADADSLVDKIVAWRKGDDGEWATDDDQRVNAPDLGLNAKESVIFSAMSADRASMSRYLRVRARGVDEASGASTVIEAVVERFGATVVSWQRE